MACDGAKTSTKGVEIPKLNSQELTSASRISCGKEHGTKGWLTTDSTKSLT